MSHTNPGNTHTAGSAEHPMMPLQIRKGTCSQLFGYPDRDTLRSWTEHMYCTQAF